MARDANGPHCRVSTADAVARQADGSSCADPRWTSAKTTASSHRRNSSCENLVDAVPIEIDDFKSPAVGIDAFTDLRQTAELAQDETGGGMEASLLGGRN